MKFFRQAPILSLCILLAGIFFLDSFSKALKSLREGAGVIIDHKHEFMETNGCVEMRNIDGLDGQWLRQPGLQNGFPYYFNQQHSLFLYMARPIPGSPLLYYTVNPSVRDTSVLNGYCSEPGLDIMDCGARWRVNYVFNTAARFEACA